MKSNLKLAAFILCCLALAGASILMIDARASTVQVIRYRVQEGVYDKTDRPIWTCPSDDGVCKASGGTTNPVPPPVDRIIDIRSRLVDKKAVLTFQQFDMASPDVCTSNTAEGGGYAPETEQPGHCNDVEYHYGQKYTALDDSGTEIWGGELKSHLTIAE